MKTTTIYLESPDLNLIRQLCPGSIHFLSLCIISEERDGYPFKAATVSWVNTRLVRRALRLLLKELVTLIKDEHPQKELLADIAIRFIDRI